MGIAVKFNSKLQHVLLYNSLDYINTVPGGQAAIITEQRAERGGGAERDSGGGAWRNGIERSGGIEIK